MNQHAAPASRRVWGVAAALALVLLPASAIAQTDAGIYRAASELNLRAGPTTGAAILGVIAPSARVEVSNCDAFGWCAVRYQDLEGWAARQFLVRTGDLPAEASATPAETGEAGTIEAGANTEVAGILTPGTPCATLRADDGTEFAIIGNVPFSPADPIVILGRTVATDACGNGTTLAVLHVRIAR
ncbi:MAG: SH3 domain-containing protein [Bauldia sp.]|nr:SH3 domain-containing protein [Bauldia sp.]